MEERALRLTAVEGLRYVEDDTETVAALVRVVRAARKEAYEECVAVLSESRRDRTASLLRRESEKRNG